jgi:CHAT domain-containing protein
VSEEQEITNIDAELAVGNRIFQGEIDQIARSFASKGEAAVKVDLLRDSEALKDDLEDLKHGAVAIYTLVTDQYYRAVLITPQIQKAYVKAISSQELARKVFGFRALLQNPHSNPKAAAKELYDIIIGPALAADLDAEHAGTIMWSLDGVLRYVPVAALYDGRRYLVESYSNNVFTPASNARLKDVPSATSAAAAFGVTKPHESFSALPEVESEINGIVGPVLSGRSLLDEAFTRNAMQSLLRDPYSIVHLATHFVFQPGSKSDSFLLLGDGSRLSLSQLETLNNIFRGVDLVTLSACETGVGEVDADGREVEGLGVIAQRKGAKAVIATLWPVAMQALASSCVISM